MGPRESLAQVRSLVKQAKTATDPAEVQHLLGEIETLIEAAIGRGTLREGRFLQVGRRGRRLDTADLNSTPPQE